MGRLTVTTTPQQVAAGAAPPARAKSVAVWQQAATGTVMFEKSTTGSAPSMSNAGRLDFSKVPAITYFLDPGVSLWAATSSGTVDIEFLDGGEAV